MIEYLRFVRVQFHQNAKTKPQCKINAYKKKINSANERINIDLLSRLFCLWMLSIATPVSMIIFWNLIKFLQRTNHKIWNKFTKNRFDASWMSRLEFIVNIMILNSPFGGFFSSVFSRSWYWEISFVLFIYFVNWRQSNWLNL